MITSHNSQNYRVLNCLQHQAIPPSPSLFPWQPGVTESLCKNIGAVLLCPLPAHRSVQPAVLPLTVAKTIFPGRL